jgi:hypothetical protein
VEVKEGEIGCKTSPADAEADEFDFIRNVTKRDDVDLVVSKQNDFITIVMLNLKYI